MSQNKKKHWKCNQHLIKRNFGGKILKNISPTFHHHPGLALKRLKGCDTYWKWTKGAVSGVKTFIFEFRTTKNHWKDIHIDNSTNLKKQPRKGVFFSPKCPRGTQGRILPKSVTVVLYLVQLPPHFDRVSEKNNGWIKCYEAKSVIFSRFRAFWGFLAIKEPLGTQRELFSKIRECYISSHIKL